MLKHIFKQLWNRKRANIWIGVELLLVFCLLWYIVDYFFVLEYNKSLHSCRDMDHTWQVEVALFPPEHSEPAGRERFDSIGRQLLPFVGPHPRL